MLRFDNIFGSGVGQIPVGSEIVSATLTIQHNAANANGNPVNLHRMLVGWDPAVATFNSFTAGVQADGVEAATAIDVVLDSTGATVPFTREVNVTTTVQAWASGAPNSGWAFLPTGTDGYRMDTAESATPPALTVAYRVVPCLTAPSITTQPPAAISVNEGSALSISVVFGNACETTYQWSKNGTDIPGATSAIYTESPAIAGASGSGRSYVLRATNPHGTVTSTPAVVTVVADTVRPVVTSVRSTSGTTITVGFSKVLNSASAQSAANYVITPSVAVSAAVLSADGRTVTLTTGTRTLGTAYSLRIQDVTDNRGVPNLINPNPTVVPLTTISVIDDWNSAWFYNTNNLDATLSGTPWYSPAYTMGADWQTGNGLFGIETSAGIVALFPTPIATPLPANTGTPADLITFYFRKVINLPTLPAGTTYAINHLIDDGAVFYLDGMEIGRLNQTNPAPVLYADRSSAAIEAALLSLPFTASAGTHTLAVEVHQGGATTSSDMLFGARVIAIPTASPQLTISRSGVGAVVNWSADSNWDLQNANVVTGPYATIAPTAFGVYSNAIPATATNQFYRLQYRP